MPDSLREKDPTGQRGLLRNARSLGNPEGSGSRAWGRRDAARLLCARAPGTGSRVSWTHFFPALRAVTSILCVHLAGGLDSWSNVTLSGRVFLDEINI